MRRPLGRGIIKSAERAAKSEAVANLNRRMVPLNPSKMTHPDIRETQDWTRATIGRPRPESGESHHAAASRPIEAFSRLSRHRTKPCSMRANGTAKVGTITLLRLP